MVAQRNDMTVEPSSSERVNKKSQPTPDRDMPSQGAPSYDFKAIQHLTSGAKSISALQRTIGNRATMQLLQPAPQPESLHIHRPALNLPPELDDSSESGHVNPRHGVTIQRAIKKLSGKSSGWFRKGQRDKINILVDAYNAREITLSGSKRSAESYTALLPDIQKIWQAAQEWYLDTMKSNAEKAQEIRAWMVAEVEHEEDAKRAQIGELQEAAALKAAFDGAAYNPLYATPDFTSSVGAAVQWLATPALAPIYRYFLIQVQFEAAALYAYEEVTKYRLNPSRTEALRIYDRFHMDAAGDLNITGEGVGGIEAIERFRAQIATLRGSPDAAVPADFGSVEKSLINVVNEMFIAFRSSTPYKKVTTAPAPPAL